MVVDVSQREIFPVTVGSAGTIVPIKTRIAYMHPVLLCQYLKLQRIIPLVQISIINRPSRLNPVHLIIVNKFPGDVWFYHLKKIDFFIYAGETLPYYILFNGT
ncbi:hypothetical protein SDC9_179866 [bioreactor metagenome]|uniref:Uncharacterized protein n=1 Tax=bioreactor metagenome TaxID=1076179 RepID=A0A645H076_9ZZZZ